MLPTKAHHRPASGSLAATETTDCSTCTTATQICVAFTQENDILKIRMLTKATSLPQITLTDFDAEQGDRVLFQETWKTPRQKINVVLPGVTSSMEPLLKTELSEESTDEHESEKGSTNNQKKAIKQNQKPSQKFSSMTNIKQKVARQYSLGPASTQNAKPKVLNNRRSSLDTGTKSILIDERRASLESSKASTFSVISKRFSQKAKSLKELQSAKNISGSTKKVNVSRTPQTDEKSPVIELAKEMDESIPKDIPCKIKPEFTEKGQEERGDVTQPKSPEGSPKRKKITFSLVNSFSDDNIKHKLQGNDKEIQNVEDTVAKDKHEVKGKQVNEAQGKVIAKHLMNKTRAGLQKFKAAAKKKGVAGPDAYDEMCDRTKTLGGTGRRIFEKKELFNEDDIKDDSSKRIKNAKSKFMDYADDLPELEDKYKDPMKSFGLWDDCDPKLVARAKGENKEEADIIAELPDWERTKEKKDEMAKYMKDYNSLVVQESSASKSKLSTGKYLPSADFEFCIKHTKFEEAEILRWFKGFRKDCPTGHLAKNHLAKLFMKVFPGGNGSTFANNIFRIFDKDNNGFMDFKEFLMALDVTTCKTREEKLEWAFRLYDIDGDGTINQDEMTTIIEILDDLGGMEVGEEYMVDGQPEVLAPAKERASNLLGAIDLDGDGGISKEEFLAVGVKLFNYGDEDEDDEL